MIQKNKEKIEINMRSGNKQKHKTAYKYMKTSRIISSNISIFKISTKNIKNAEHNYTDV